MSEEIRDVNGNLIVMGSEMEVVSGGRNSWANGSLGHVVAFDGDIWVGVRHDEHNANGNELLGHCPNYFGYWYHGEHLRALSPILESDDIDALLVDRLSKSQSYAFIGGTAYQLAPVVAFKPEDIMAKVAEEAKGLVQQMKQRYDAKEKKLREQLSSAHIMPDITSQDVDKGMRVWKSEEGLVYTIPFHFAPKFISNRSDSRYRLHEDDVVATKREALLSVIVRGGGTQHVHLSESLNSEDSGWEYGQSFGHYHNNCLGSLQYPEIKQPSDVFNFGKEYEEVLTLVDKSNLGSHGGQGMPHPDILWERRLRPAIPMGEGGLFSTIAPVEPADPDAGVEGEIHVGSYVRVIRAVNLFPDEGVGSIGRVVAVPIDESDNRAAVEFLTSNIALHNCNELAESEHGYNFPLDCLRLIDAVRRTRFAGDTGRDEDASTTPEWALDLSVREEEVPPAPDGSGNGRTTGYGMGWADTHSRVELPSVEPPTEPPTGGGFYS